MSENTPVLTEHSLTLQAVELLTELKNILLTSAHIQSVRGDTVYVNCFRQHVLEANNRMLIPLSEQALNQVMTPVTTFVHAIVNNPQPNRSVCLALGAILNQLIVRRILTADHFHE